MRGGREYRVEKWIERDASICWRTERELGVGVKEVEEKVHTWVLKKKKEELEPS